MVLTCFKYDRSQRSVEIQRLFLALVAESLMLVAIFSEAISSPPEDQLWWGRSPAMLPWDPRIWAVSTQYLCSGPSWSNCFRTKPPRNSSSTSKLRGKKQCSASMGCNIWGFHGDLMRYINPTHMGLFGDMLAPNWIDPPLEYLGFLGWKEV